MTGLIVGLANKRVTQMTTSRTIDTYTDLNTDLPMPVIMTAITATERAQASAFLARVRAVAARALVASIR